MPCVFACLLSSINRPTPQESYECDINCQITDDELRKITLRLFSVYTQYVSRIPSLMFMQFVIHVKVLGGGSRVVVSTAALHASLF